MAETSIVGLREGVDYINGRPDFANRQFGRTTAKKHPPFVFSVLGNSALVHKIAYVELAWWRGENDRMFKLHTPRMTAHCSCGWFCYLKAERTRTCRVPSPDALLCGRCHGEAPSFSAHGAATKSGVSRQWAHVRLGCVVNGYGASA